MSQVPVVVLTSMDPVLRDSTVFAAVADVPGVVVLRHDLSSARSTGTMRRVVSDVGGVVEDETLLLEHSCLSCALREDVLPTLARLVRAGRWAAVVLALPVASDPVPVLRALGGELAGGEVARLVHVSSVLAVVDGAGFAGDLFGEDLLADRGLATVPEDRRSVGEVLAAQVEAADLVVAHGLADAVARDLLAHLGGPAVPVVEDLHGLAGAELLRDRHDVVRGARTGDPRWVEPTGAQDTDRVWTLDLHSWRPMHPARLLDRIETLAAGPCRGRGRLWLPTRPGARATGGGREG
jgi:G3E family GTPase